MSIEAATDPPSEMPNHNESHLSIIDMPSVSSLSPLSTSDLTKCNMCLGTTQITLGHPTCHHVFCAPCIKRVQSSATPDSCPLCVFASHTSENGATVCGKCSTTASHHCVHCSEYMCNSCQEGHVKSGGEFEKHIVLHLKKANHSELSGKWLSTHSDTSFWSSVEVPWPSESSRAEKSWNNASGTSVLDHSWMNSGSFDNVWGLANGRTSFDKKWMQSTAKKGCPEGLIVLPAGLRGTSSDDSLMILSSSSGAGPYSDTTDPTTGSSSVDLHSLYDQIVAPQAAGLYNTSHSLTDSSGSSVSGHRCLRHESEIIAAFCKTCEAGVCNLCVDAQTAPCHNHDYVVLNASNKESYSEYFCSLLTMKDRTLEKTEELTNAVTSVEETVEKLKLRYREDEVAVMDAFDVYLKALIDRRQEIGAELQFIYKSKLEQLKEIKESTVFNVQQLGEAKELIRTLLVLGGPFNERAAQLSHIYNQLRTTLENIFAYCPDFDRKSFEDIRFVCKYQNIHSAVRNTFGFIQQSGVDKCGADLDGIYPLKKVFSAVELTSNESLNDFGYLTSGVSDRLNFGRMRPGGLGSLAGSKDILGAGNFMAEMYGNGGRTNVLMSSGNVHLAPGAGLESVPGKMLPASSSMIPSALAAPGLYESRTMALRNGFSIISVDSDDEMSKVIMPSFCPSEFKRKKMEYHVKFGEFGCESHQFYEPSGVAVTPDNHILVADANNHRIQAFDRNGNYLKTIGQDHINGGEGDLVYPNRLAVNQTTGDIIVTERSPTHQVNVYNKDGRFIRKFGASILQHPRGIAVDNMGRIIVVECKVMRVVIFSIVGSVLNRFIVDKHVNFPNGVAVNDKEEIFISDNRRHGVVVFDYHGSFLRTVGGMGITNYPIGVGISSTGEVVIADNHNNFNVTVFSQDGVPLRALESRVKHAQCFDIALLDRGSIVLSSKDFRVYVYQYGPSSVELNPLAAPVIPLAFRQVAGYMG